MKNLDYKCLEECTDSVIKTANWLLVADYSYRHLHTNIISDTVFDQLCAKLMSKMDELLTLNVGHFFSKECLATGWITHNYPLYVPTLARQLIKHIDGEAEWPMNW